MKEADGRPFGLQGTGRVKRARRVQVARVLQ